MLQVDLTVVVHWHSVIYDYMYLFASFIVWVSLLNIEFDCKSNNLNCGKFRTEDLFSPPPSRLFLQVWVRRILERHESSRPE